MTTFMNTCTYSHVFMKLAIICYSEILVKQKGKSLRTPKMRIRMKLLASLFRNKTFKFSVCYKQSKLHQTYDREGLLSRASCLHGANNSAEIRRTHLGTTTR